MGNTLEIPNNKYLIPNKLFNKKFIYIGISLGIIAKIILINYYFGDYTGFLSGWTNTLRVEGFVAFEKPFYNYTPLYMYALWILSKIAVYSLYTIKIFSFFFDYILAFYVGKIAFLLSKDKRYFWFAFVIVPIIPSVLLNSALMSQCDGIYTTFVIMSIYYLFTNRQFLSMVLLGIAVSLKIQMFMIMPFFFVYMLRGHIKWYKFLIMPIVYLITITPAWIAGRPLSSLLSVYLEQSQGGDGMIMVAFFPNMYVWFGDSLNGHVLTMSVLVALFVFIGGLILSNKKYVFTVEAWIQLMFLSAIICPFFLPGMHERFMYMGDTIAILYAIVCSRKAYFSLGIIFTSFYAYVQCLHAFSLTEFVNYPIRLFSFFEFIPWGVASVIYALCIVGVLYELIQTLKRNSNEKEFVSYNLIENK